ncbi:formate/nitrite transporter family protein [Halorientalis brevis]|uniref:Formate/nitrite transporter family protein n=1 Tax=Halorientalis brevis TaxID=1126241 RepID=A0ABD6C7X9_9EURY|nr:formate/nitrite transporter family protein [Halorientalis brevis]
MGVQPDPSEVFQRAVDEGQRRLDQSPLELFATSFIAGFTIVFGIAALGIVEAAFASQFEDIASVAGALIFGTGIVFLVVGRAELFTENFFDPVAAAAENSQSWLVSKLVRLWVVTFVLNLVGGALMVWVLSVDGALPSGTAHALRGFAEDTVVRDPVAGFAKGITGGGLVTLLSFLLSAVNSVRSQITVSYMVGVLLALGPFDHVIVTVLHLLFGVFFGADIGLGTLAEITAVVTAGNIVGGLGLVTLSHIAQVQGAREDGG